MLCLFTVAALVSLFSVDVSCNLLQQLEDSRVGTYLPQPPQQWEENDYSYQPQGSAPTIGRSFASNEGPRPQLNSFSGSFSRGTVDPAPQPPEPSSGGCAKNPDFPNFPGSPSMVFNPGAHVNFVIGVPEDYKMDITDAPEGWKIITIMAPEGRDSISLGPNAGKSQQDGLLGNGSFYPAGLDGLPSAQFPFMRPLGSLTGSLMPETILAPVPSGSPDQHPEGLYPRSRIPVTGPYLGPMGPSGSYPYNGHGQYPEDSDDHSGPLKPGYHRKPGSQTLGMESYPRHPEGQYRIPSSSRPPVPGYDQPEPESLGIRVLQIPSGREMYPDSQYPDNLNILPGAAPGQKQFPRTHGPFERLPEGAHPDNSNPFKTSAPGYKPLYQTPGIEYPDEQFPDNFPGSHSPQKVISPRFRGPTDNQSPGIDSFSRPHPSSSSYPDGKQLDGMRSPSGPQFQQPGSLTPPGTGRVPNLNGESEMYPNGQYPHDSPEKYPVFANDLSSPGSSRPGSQTPAIRPLGPHGPSDRYPDGGYPHSTVSHLKPGFVEPGSPSTPEQGTFPRPVGQHERYPDGQYVDNITSPPEYHTPGMRTPPSQYGQPDGQYPRVQGTPPGAPDFMNPAHQTPGSGRSTSHPTGIPGKYTDVQQPDNIKFPGHQNPEMRMSPIGQYRQPEGLIPGAQRSPSEAHDMFTNPAYSTPMSQRSPLHPSGMQGRYPDGHQTPDIRTPTGRYGQPGGQYNGAQSSPSAVPDSINPAYQTPGSGGHQLHPIGIPEKYPNGQHQGNVNFPEHQIPGIRTPSSQYGQPDGLYLDVQRSPSGAPDLINSAHQTPGSGGYQSLPIGIPEKYPSGQHPGDLNFPEHKTPGMKTPASQYGQPGGQYLGIGRSPSGAPDFINPADQTPGLGRSPSHLVGIPGRSGGQYMEPSRLPGSYPSGQHPNDQISPSSSLVPRFNEPTFPKPGMERYDKQRGPLVRFPDGPSGPSGSRFDEPVSPAPETGRSDGPYEQYPGRQSPSYKSPYPGSHAPGHSTPESQTQRTGGVLSPSMSGMFPDGQYPQAVGTVPGMHPDGQSPIYIIDLSSVSQTPGMGKLMRPSITSRGDQTPNDVGSQLRFPSQRVNQLGQQNPGSGGSPRPSWQTGKSPDSFNRPQGFQQGAEINFPVGRSSEIEPSGHYPENVGGLTHPRGPGYEPAHPIQGMKGFPQPVGSSQGYPDGLFPDNIRSSPGQQALSPRYQPGHVLPVTDRFATPSQLYSQGQAQGRPEPLLGPAPTGQYLENVNMDPRILPQGYKIHFQTPGARSVTGPSSPLNQGSTINLPDYVRQLLEPYTTLGNKKPSLSPSETGRYPKPSGSPQENQINQYPDGKYPSDDHYPENMANRPGNMGSRFSQPGFQSPGDETPANPREPSDPIDQYNQGPVPPRYNKPGYQEMPHEAQEPISGETSINGMEFPEGIRHSPQGQDGITKTGGYGGSPRMNAPDFGMPDHDSSAPGRSPTGGGTEPHRAPPMDGPHNFDRSGPSSSGSPSAIMRPQTSQESPQRPRNVGYTDGESPDTYQNQPLSTIGGQSPDNARSGQDGSPGGRMAQPRSPPSSYTTGGANPTSSDVRSPVTGTMINQGSPSMGMITTSRGSESGPRYEAPSELSNIKPHDSSMRMITMGGIPQSGSSYDVSYPQSTIGTQGLHMLKMTTGNLPGQTRTVMTGGPQVTGNEGPQFGYVRPLNPSGSSMIIRYPQSTSLDVSGGYGSQSMGPDGSMRMTTTINGGGSPQSNVVQSKPAIIKTYYQSPQQNLQTVQSSNSGETSSMGSYSYHTAPSTSFKTLYPLTGNAQGHITYSSPNIQYQQPRQTIVYRPGSSSVSIPSYSQTYLQNPIAAVRSLDS